jgi:hypothetical protein
VALSAWERLLQEREHVGPGLLSQTLGRLSVALIMGSSACYVRVHACVRVCVCVCVCMCVVGPVGKDGGRVALN